MDLKYEDGDEIEGFLGIRKDLGLKGEGDRVLGLRESMAGKCWAAMILSWVFF